MGRIYKQHNVNRWDKTDVFDLLCGMECAKDDRGPF